MPVGYRGGLFEETTRYSGAGVQLLKSRDRLACELMSYVKLGHEWPWYGLSANRYQVLNMDANSCTGSSTHTDARTPYGEEPRGAVLAKPRVLAYPAISAIVQPMRNVWAP